MAGRYPGFMLQSLKYCNFLIVSAEGRGKTEAAEEAAGAPDTRPPTLPPRVAAAARPGAMETPRSAQTSQHGGDPSLLVFCRFPERNIQSVCSQVLQLNTIRTQQLVVYILAIMLESY